MTTTRIARILGALALTGTILGVAVGWARDYSIEHAQDGIEDDLA